MNVKEISLAAIFGSLYAVLVVIPGYVPSSGPVQLRVADCLIPLAALLGWPIIVGVTIGCFAANTYFWLGIQDVAIGPIANLIAATMILLLRRRPLFACIVGALMIGLIVGGYLWILLPAPDIFGLPVWAAMIVSITISSLITVAALGYALLRTLSTPSMLSYLKSYGLKVYIKE